MTRRRHLQAPNAPRRANLHRAAQLRQRCWAGLEPADLLTTLDREALIYDLWEKRWTDLEIAVHTRLSTYTVARIRDRLKLPARRPGNASLLDLSEAV